MRDTETVLQRVESPLILAVDTAGSACSVAIARGGLLLAEDRREMRHGHGEALLPMIAALAERTGYSAAAFDLIAANSGPGGFTGIRVGLAAVQGIALATRRPAIGVTGFAAVMALLSPDSAAPVLVALDSRRSDLYVALFAGDGHLLCPPASIGVDDLGDWIEAASVGSDTRMPLRLAGDAGERAGEALAGRKSLVILGDTAPEARGVAYAAREIWHRPEPIERVRPFYLRPPDVTRPASPLP